MVVIGLGTNLGTRKTLLKAIVEILKREVLKTVHLSSLYESKALLPQDAPAEWDQNFLNMAILGETHLAPLELLTQLKDIEKEMGRTSSQRWAPRIIDLDILCWDDLVFEDKQLSIPHRELLKRPFALWPLADLLPDWIHPKTRASAGAQAIALKKASAQSETWRVTGLSTELVGILNITPDSFSDGGKYFSAEQAKNQANVLVKSGAFVLDIGAESTRPGAQLLAPSQEWQRLKPVLEAIKELLANHHSPPQLSVDTRHAEVARQCLPLGLAWVNDVSGGDDPEMVEMVSQYPDLKIVIMHHLDLPPRRDQTLSRHCDPLTQIMEWGARRIEQLLIQEVSLDQIIFDPGIGFGLNPFQSLQVIAGAHRLRDLKVPILIGHSRKSFFNLLPPKPVKIVEESWHRDFLTAQLSGYLLNQGVDFLRVHSADLNRRALDLRMVLGELE